VDSGESHIGSIATIEQINCRCSGVNRKNLGEEKS
jgi:hypothetical protein